jgi:protein-S-isoprenylcysteine O-methyltransferase Ste14
MKSLSRKEMIDKYGDYFDVRHPFLAFGLTLIILILIVLFWDISKFIVGFFAFVLIVFWIIDLTKFIDH